MKIVLYSILLLISVILQVSLVGKITVFHSVPDLCIIMLAFAALGTNRNYTTLAGFFTGFLRDVFGYGIPGTGSLIFSITGFLAGSLLSKRVFHKKIEVLLVFAIYIFLYYFLAHFFINFMQNSFWSGMFSHILPQVIYTLIISVIIVILTPEKAWKKQTINPFDSY